MAVHIFDVCRVDYLFGQVVAVGVARQLAVVVEGARVERFEFQNVGLVRVVLVAGGAALLVHQCAVLSLIQWPLFRRACVQSLLGQQERAGRHFLRRCFVRHQLVHATRRIDRRGALITYRVLLHDRIDRLRYRCLVPVNLRAHPALVDLAAVIRAALFTSDILFQLLIVLFFLIARLLNIKR